MQFLSWKISAGFLFRLNYDYYFEKEIEINKVEYEKF